MVKWVASTAFGLISAGADDTQPIVPEREKQQHKE
jgi:hypothetical protein